MLPGLPNPMALPNAIHLPSLRHEIRYVAVTQLAASTCTHCGLNLEMVDKSNTKSAYDTPSDDW